VTFRPYKPARPGDLPELRHWLQEQWKFGEGLFWQFAQMTAQQRGLPGGVAVTEDGRSIDLADSQAVFVMLEANFDDKSLKGAPLYWVTEEMAELIDMASRTLPPTTLTPEICPSPTGLVYFAKPLHGLAAADVLDRGYNFHTLEVAMVVWGESQIPPGPHSALGISTYLIHEGILTPAGRTDWEWGVDSDEPISELISEDAQRIESMAEDRRWLATFWLLLSQSGVASTTLVRPQRQSVRRIERAGGTIPKEQLEVRVVNVHAPKTHHAEPTGESRDVNWQQRWIVSPHWRQQAYGPNHSLRRPTLIGPYIKGPADKPLVIKDTVQVLKDGEL
jgi:hypothetical protein